MKFVLIADAVSVFLLIAAGIFAMIFLRKNRDKPIEEYRRPMLAVINAITVLTVVSAILTILMIILKK